LLAFLLLAAMGCRQRVTERKPGTAEKGPITIGSKIDTEGSVLGQMIKQMLEANGFEVVNKIGLGTTDVNRKALLAGEIDVYPEYTGTAISLFFEGQNIPPETSRDAAKSYETVKELDRELNKIVWLERAPANNTWAIAVTQDLAGRNNLKTMADFARYVNDSGRVKLVASQEFVERPDALKAFENAYGFRLKPDQLIALAGGNTAQTESAAAKGTDGANAAMAYGTDGGLDALKLVVLADPKGAQPVYEPAPIFRAEVMEKYPEIPGIVNPVFRTLDEETLQNLNGQIALEGQNPASVAQSYLEKKGFLK
jgi:osmoprotectant transport system substrate-binding protein